MLSYTRELGEKECNYLLVPEGFTVDQNQKEKIVKTIFDTFVYELYRTKILSDEDRYDEYIYEDKNGKDVRKKKVVKFINDELGDGSAREGNGYLTSKGLLDLINKYPVIKKFIESDIKK